MNTVLRHQEKLKINKLLAKKPTDSNSDGMIKKTKDYDMFIFREDNREKIDKNHVRKLIQSIKSRNLLEFRPIAVNADMEIIDGQHRVLAAKELDVEIYYQINEELDSKDIILMNISKSWGFLDYLNYYVKNGYDEYIKLDRFMKENGLPLKTALSIHFGGIHQGFNDFREGRFKCSDENINESLNICWKTIEIIKKNHSQSPYLNTNKFWRALIKLVKHPEFNEEHWFNNLNKLANNITIKVSEKDYIYMFLNVYNYRRTDKLSFTMEIT